MEYEKLTAAMKTVMAWHDILSTAEKLEAETGWNLRAFWRRVHHGDFQRAYDVLEGFGFARLEMQREESSRG